MASHRLSGKRRNDVGVRTRAGDVHRHPRQLPPARRANQESAYILTIDLRHVHCLGERDIHELLSRSRGRIVIIHVEDMVGDVDEHLILIRVPWTSRQSVKIAFDKGVHAELAATVTRPLIQCGLQ